MKTLSSYFLTNHQYARYFLQKHNLHKVDDVDVGAFGTKINDMCSAYNIDFSPYYFTLIYESPKSVESFANFFITMLNKAEMYEYSSSLSTNSNLDKVIEIMSTDIDYLLAGIACIQYFFL